MELRTLLAHNSATKIIWEHGGWSTEGTATDVVLTEMLATYPNLYIALKNCHSTRMETMPATSTRQA